MKTIMNLLLVICLVFPMASYAQEDFNNLTNFKLINVLSADEGYSILPPAISKNGQHLYFVLEKNESEFTLIKILNLSGSGQTTWNNTLNISLSGRSFSGQVSFSADEQTMSATFTKDNSWGNNEIGIATRTENSQKFNSVKLVSEINKEEEADAYSWLSADAKRIYWMRDESVMFAKRKKANGKFSKPVELKFKTGSLGVRSVWLTPDEKRIFFIATNNNIYVSEMISETLCTEPVLFADDLQGKGFLSAISFTPDLKLMAVYYSGPAVNETGGDETKQVLIFSVLK